MYVILYNDNISSILCNDNINSLLCNDIKCNYGVNTIKDKSKKNI